MDPHPTLARCIDEVRHWAADNESALVLAPVAPADLDALAARIRPHFGAFRYAPPPSYRAFLERYGSAQVEVEDEALDWPFRVYDLDEVVARTRGQVHLPAGVDRGDGRALSTNHFVAFAAARAYDDACWCFDASAPGPELPVYLYNQNLGLGAKLVDGGEWEDPDDAAPAFADFAAWLEAETRILVEMEEWGI